MTSRPPHPPPPDDDGDLDDEMPPPRDELDALLREWHAVHADRARAGRDRLLATLKAEPDPARAPATGGARPVIHIIRRTIVNRYSPVAAAALVALAVVISYLVPATTPSTFAGQRDNIVLCPEGGRLEALDPEGNPLGPCELARTDVDVQISGFLTRVTLRQTFHNPHPDKIEAVYTFPLSHRAAVDRMQMIIGDRVIVGEVKERETARQLYESAREQGRTASLLEQERPNIFTQSVANIEPGARIDVEISYVELLEPSDGTYTFSFPTVVGPRYIPGKPAAADSDREHALPDWLTPRRGLVLLAPATVTITSTGPGGAAASITPARLAQLLASAVPCYPKGHGDKAPPAHPPILWHDFTVTYPDGSSEPGALDADGSGHVGGRCFWIDPQLARSRDPSQGQGFASNTNQIPDASRITPMPNRPETRAGHTLGISVTLDTGGPAVEGLAAPLHAVETTPLAGSKIRVNLKNQAEIPNRDFVLNWRLAGGEVQESIFTHTGEHGNFFSLILQPPARVEPDLAVPRELIFVLDTSGSMQGYPIEKAKQVMAKAIDSMRERDTFNVITFSGDTHILWDRPRPNTPKNRAEAQNFLANSRSGGGTEMMKAIEAALAVHPGPADPQGPRPLTLEELANLPADGREVVIELPWGLGHDEDGRIEVRPGLRIRFGEFPPPENGVHCPVGEPRLVTGIWETADGDRLFRPTSVRWKNGATPHNALRIVTFMTDGYVGNDMAIIDAIKRHRGTTRVFSFGIGNSVNRYLLDGMARAGGGEAEYVLLESDADEAVQRFARRIATPVLANINVAFSDGLRIVDVLPAPEDGGIPDLFDQKPLVIFGRYTAPGSGTVTITGMTGRGPYSRTIPLTLPAHEPKHDVTATLWARRKIDSLMSRDLAAAQSGALPDDLRRQIVTIGETFGIMSQFTSFVAIDKLRVTIAGQPRLVTIPIEMPDRVSYEGVFGESMGNPVLGFESTRLGKEVMRGRVAMDEDDSRMRRDLSYAKLQLGDRVGRAEIAQPRKTLPPVRRAPARSAGGPPPTSAPAMAAGRPLEPAPVPGDSAVTIEMMEPAVDAQSAAPGAAETAAGQVPQPDADPVLHSIMSELARTDVAIFTSSQLDPADPILVALKARKADLESQRDHRAAILANPTLACLAPVLVTLATRPDLPDSLDPSYHDKPKDLPWHAGGVLVTILVASADEATLKAIRDLGAQIEYSSTTARIIIAAVPLGRLGDLAAVAGVRRVEPARLEPPGLTP